MAGGPVNSNNRADVERIVRQVLAELSRTSATRTASGGELVLTKRVVSAADVEGRLNGVSRVVVQRGAVFTPAARDELRKHQVTVASAVQKSAATGTVALAVDDDAYDVQPLLAALLSDNVQLERLGPTTLLPAIEQLCQRVTRGQWGLLITRVSSAALCLANRRAGVRAALGTDVPAVAAAVEAVAQTCWWSTRKARACLPSARLHASGCGTAGAGVRPHCSRYSDKPQERLGGTERCESAK